MDEQQFSLLLEQIGDLSPAQFKELVKSYAGHSGQDAKRVWEQSVYAVSEQHLADLGVNRACPGCGSVAVVHNSLTDAGVQRLHCQDCGKNFTRFTGTLLEKSRFPWDVWVETLKMVLGDASLTDIRTVLEQDLGCEGIDIKTVFAMRMKLIHAMATVEPPKLIGVIQMDESFLRESQKGHNRELFSYVKDIERVPRYGYHPSKLGTMGAEFATILTAIDERGYCVCKTVYFNHLPFMGLLLVLSLGAICRERGRASGSLCFVDNPCAALLRMGVFAFRGILPYRSPRNPALLTTRPNRGMHHVTQSAVGAEGQKNRRSLTFLVLYDSEVP